MVAAITRTSTSISSVPPDPADLPLLQRAQQLDLHGRRGLPHLVEEERAAVGGLEEALLALPGVGEGALHVPEQLALEQGVGQRPAVDADERPRRARPESPWIARATSSLPVPLSPVISTVELVGATARTISNSDAITAETPITLVEAVALPRPRA